MSLVYIITHPDVVIDPDVPVPQRRYRYCVSWCGWNAVSLPLKGLSNQSARGVVRREWWKLLLL